MKLIFCATSYSVEIKNNLYVFLSVRILTFEKMFPTIEIKFPFSWSSNAIVGEALLNVLTELR